MKAIDQVLVEGQGEQFALLAPEVINDYVETLGKPCQNPLGYTAGSLILAKDLEGVQRMFKVTANISSSQNVVEGTNVERKKLEDLFDGIEEEIGDVDQELGSVKQALSNEAEARATLGAHNLLKPFYFAPHEVGGITFSANGNGTYNYVGTSTASPAGKTIANLVPLSEVANLDLNKTYRLSDGNNSSKGYGVVLRLYNGSTLVTELDTRQGDVTFTLSDYTFTSVSLILVVTNGTVISPAITVKPQITLASDSYAEFTPYAPTNAELLSADANAELGAHNSFNLSLAKIKSINTTGTWSDNSYTKNNVTFAITAEGDTVTNIAVSTTNAGSSAETDLVLDNSFKHESGEYLMNGCPSGGGVNKYGWYLHVPAGYIFDFGTERSVSFDSSVTYDATIRIYNGQIITTAVNFKPMFRLASDPSNKFTPYAMTNRELTALCSLGALLENKTILTSSDDMDNITDSGVYGTTGTSIPANYPEAGSNNAVIFVMGLDSKGYVVQIWISRNSSKIYYRWYTRTSSPQWGGWYAISGTSL